VFDWVDKILFVQNLNNFFYFDMLYKKNKNNIILIYFKIKNILKDNFYGILEYKNIAGKVAQSHPEFVEVEWNWVSALDCLNSLSFSPLQPTVENRPGQLTGNGSGNYSSWLF
jgi:hypothetical protein